MSSTICTQYRQSTWPNPTSPHALQGSKCSAQQKYNQGPHHNCSICTLCKHLNSLDTTTPAHAALLTLASSEMRVRRQAQARAELGTNWQSRGMGRGQQEGVDGKGVDEMIPGDYVCLP